MPGMLLSGLFIKINKPFLQPTRSFLNFFLMIFAILENLFRFTKLEVGYHLDILCF